VLPERQMCYLLFCHVFTGCDTLQASALYEKFSARDVDEYMDVFLDLHATKDIVIGNGILLFSDTITMHQVIH